MLPQEAEFRRFYITPRFQLTNILEDELHLTLLVIYGTKCSCIPMYIACNPRYCFARVELDLCCCMPTAYVDF